MEKGDHLHLHHHHRMEIKNKIGWGIICVIVFIYVVNTYATESNYPPLYEIIDPFPFYDPPGPEYEIHLISYVNLIAFHSLYTIAFWYIFMLEKGIKKRVFLFLSAFQSANFIEFFLNYNQTDWHVRIMAMIGIVTLIIIISVLTGKKT